MEGKTAVSRSSQIVMEAFVPWVQQRLNDLLGIPEEDERRRVLTDLKVGLEAWTNHELNTGVSGLQQEDQSLEDIAKVNLVPLLVPWIEHQLIDLLWSPQQRKVKGALMASVASKFDDLFSPILVQLYDLVLQTDHLSGQPEEDEVMDPMLVSQIKFDVNESLYLLVEHKLTDELKIKRPEAVHDAVTELQGMLGRAKAVLQEPAGDREWVDDLVGVCYEILALLEEWRKTAVKKEDKVSSSFPSSITKSKQLKAIKTSLESLEKTSLESLKKLSDRSHSRTYHVRSKHKFGSILSSSRIDESEVMSCRKHEIKSVVKHLLLPGEKAIKVMSIVGRGGIGKTSVARFVFNAPRVEKHFPLKVWISVSNFFDDKRLAQDLLRSIGKDSVEGVEELDSVALFQLVEKSFSGKVFLCVFDDVWTEDSSMWMQFALLFKNGSPGSRILVTTRSEKTVRVVASDWEHHLKPLPNKDWWLIWRYSLVLSDQNTISEQMVKIGSKLAAKCQGLPLAAVALGDILIYKSTAEEWLNELKKVSDMKDEIWRMRGVAFEIFRHFHWSYGMLSPALKLCILYCTDFDKGTVMIVDQLIRMWMALGYLGDSFEEDEMKTKRGLEYFDHLASHSFFHDVVKGSIHKNKTTSCKLSDTFHDFIRYEARHDLAKLDHQGKRRERYFHIAVYGRVPENFNCMSWKDVSALVLSSSQLEEVPSEVGELSHVQYLDLSNNPLKVLPETVCKLECLEYLDVHRCYLLLCLPQHLQKLKQLKHLRVDCTTNELHKCLPEGFKELTLIRTLDVFRTGGSVYKDAMKKLKGFTYLTDICISVHGEVKFSDATFDTKVHLVNLELCFVEEGLDQEKASKIMEDFSPPPNLAMLKLDNYPLMELPKGILELKTLTRLSIRSALNITSFPYLWKLPSLEFLWLYDIVKLKHIGREFFGLDILQTSALPIDETDNNDDDDDDDDDDDGPDDEEKEDIDYINDDVDIPIQDMCSSPEPDKIAVSFPKLRTLRIECMKNLEEWQDITEAEKKESLVSIMPSLEELSTPGCPKLVEKPLYILRDTPWFKCTNPTNPMNSKPPPSKGSCSIHEEKEEVIKTSTAIQTSAFELPGPPFVEHRLVKSKSLPESRSTSTQAGTSFDKLPGYTKLRKFVHETYNTEGVSDHYEVSIPKGVLGNVEVTACLLSKDLYEWFQPYGWVFAEQLCIWSKFIYQHMTSADKERVQMVSSALITTIGRKEDHPDTRAEDLVSFMIENKARLYLVPFLRPGHWELLAIVPENRAVYRFDSLQGNLKTDLTELLKMVEKRYVSETSNSTKSRDCWRILDIKHKRQTGNWECGYYVMLWMREIATDIQSLDLELHFPLDDSPHEPDEIERLKQEWCAYVLPEFPV